MVNLRVATQAEQAVAVAEVPIRLIISSEAQAEQAASTQVLKVKAVVPVAPVVRTQEAEVAAGRIVEAHREEALAVREFSSSVTYE